MADKDRKDPEFGTYAAQTVRAVFLSHSSLRLSYFFLSRAQVNPIVYQPVNASPPPVVNQPVNAVSVTAHTTNANTNANATLTVSNPNTQVRPLNRWADSICECCKNIFPSCYCACCCCYGMYLLSQSMNISYAFNCLILIFAL